MNRPKLSEVRGHAAAAIARVRAQRFFQDRLSLALMLPALGFNVVTILVLVLRLRPSNFLIPVHYSSLGGFDELGPWYQTFRIAGFGLAVTITNTALAAYSFTRSRIASFYLLTGAFVVGLFCLIIGTAFAVVV